MFATSAVKNRLSVAGLAFAVAMALIATLLPGSPVAAHLSELEGLYGGTVRAVAVAPGAGVVLAATDQGLFRSADGGESWQQTGSGMHRRLVSDVAFRSDGANVAFAAVEGVLYRTANGGLTWSPVTLGGSDIGADEIVISDVQPDRMLVRDHRGLAASTDGGATWSVIYTAPGYVSEAAMSPDGETLLVCGQSSGVNTIRRSTDAGATWAAVAFRPMNCGEFAWDTAAPQNVWTDTGGILKRSTDAGLTWTSASTPFPYTPALRVVPGEANSLVIAGQDAHVGLVGRTSDGGQTWTVARTDAKLISVDVDPVHTDLIVAGSTEAGIRRSADGGATFTVGNEGLTAQPALAVATDPRDAGVVYASLGDGGTFRSADAGRTWQPIHALMRPAASHPLATVSAEELAVDADGHVFAAGFLDWAWGITRSGDGGQTWSEPVRLGSTYPRAVVTHPTQPDVLLVGTSGTNPEDNRGSVYRSTDGGQTWLQVGPENAGMFDVVRHRASRIVYALVETPTSQLWRSDDFGMTWSQSKVPTGTHPARVVATGETADVVYAGYLEVRRSDDGGATWTAAADHDNQPPGVVTSLAVDPADPAQVFAGTERHGLWVSHNRGVSWARASTGGAGESIEDIGFPPPADPLDATAYRDQPVLMGAARWATSGLWRVTPAPTVRRRPAISGTAKVFKTLTCSSGRWSRSKRYRYRWLRSGNPIDGATAATYRTTRADQSRKLRCRVTAGGRGGTTRALSRRTVIR